MTSWDLVPWMVLPIILPLSAAILAFLLDRRYLPWLLITLIILILLNLAALTTQVWQEGSHRHIIGGWGAPLGIELYIDGLGLLMLWLTTSVGSLISLYALAYFRPDATKAEHFWPLWMLLWTALNALFLAADLFNLYVTLELLTLAAVSLVTLAGGRTALEAGLRYLLFALLGSFSYLLGVAILYGSFGTLDIAQLSETLTSGPSSWVAATLITLGLLTKTAIFPLHSWLPPAHSSAPAPVSALLSGLVVKASFYLLIRLWFTVFSTMAITLTDQLLGLLGAMAILYGSFLALYQVRLKLLVAYSTVAQLGYLLLLFPLAGSLAWQGTMIYVLSHGLAKAALFLAAGNLLHALGHDRIAALNGTGHRFSLTLFAFAVAGITIMGLPPSGGFLAKWLLLQAALTSGQWWWAPFILIGGLLAAGYIFRVLKQAFANPATASIQANTSLVQFEGTLEKTTLPRSMELIPLFLALLALGLGFSGYPLLTLLAIGSPYPLQEQGP